MKKHEKHLLQNKLEFLRLAYLITRCHLSGIKPNKKLIEQVRILRILADFSKEELDTILKC
jgi:hypothetical protein